jgi:hypothetical protein
MVRRVEILPHNVGYLKLDFFPDTSEHAAIANPDEDPLRHMEIREAKGMRAGGYGVLLTRKLVDELIYSEKGNDVLLVKYVGVTQLPN